MLEIVTFTLGPVQTNTYLVGDSAHNVAVVIDPASDGEVIVQEAQRRGWRIGSIWLTHAHFDHLAGSAGVADLTDPPPVVALHPADYPLWRIQGGAAWFGMKIDPGPEPVVDLLPGMNMQIGGYVVEVRHTPGHTPGHVIFICLEMQVAFVGDVIFSGSIGRTDLPGGDFEMLIASIQSQILTLPDNVRLYPGHGSYTTIGEERQTNPYLVE